MKTNTRLHTFHNRPVHQHNTLTMVGMLTMVGLALGCGAPDEVAENQPALTSRASPHELTMASLAAGRGAPEEAAESRQPVTEGPSPYDVQNFRVTKEQLEDARKERRGPMDDSEPNPTNWSVPFGAGVAHWLFSYPAGDGYSVKDEYSNSQFWASSPSQDVDGVYRRLWGCVALKVPDDCDYYNNGTTHWCNCWVSTCTVISPSSVGWPACPL